MKNTILVEGEECVTGILGKNGSLLADEYKLGGKGGGEKRTRHFLRMGKKGSQEKCQKREKVQGPLAVQKSMSKGGK